MDETLIKKIHFTNQLKKYRISEAELKSSKNLNKYMKGRTEMFNPKFEKRDNMPVYHYPLPISSIPENSNWEKILNENASITSKKNNLYVHLPFCKSICNFCSFTKWICNEQILREYIETLKIEMKMYSKIKSIKEKEFSAVYFGGGTPSLLSKEQLGDILFCIRENFKLTENCEITIEGNPSSFSEEKIKYLIEHGVTRISMGVQTFKDNLVKILGIPQIPSKTKELIKNVTALNLDAISIDLIYNIPTQSLDDWRDDIKTAINLGIKQLTIFPLTLAPFTKLYKKIENNELPQRLQQDGEFEFYFEAIKILKENGFKQLTNVDWIKPNSNYKYCKQHFQDQAQILGLGVGAFGELNGFSYINTGDMDEYLEKIKNYQMATKKIAPISNELQYQFIAMKFRCLEISDDEFSKTFGVSIFDVFKEQIKECVDKELILIDNSKIKVTELGAFYLYNMSRMFYSEKYKNVNPFSTSVEMISKN